MKKILINFVHPIKSRSKINRALLDGIKNVEGVTINDLYSKYPDYFIDVEEEQKQCINHDVIVFQFPLYWFSSPSLLKEWQDLVLEYGWAHGYGGNALKGKKFMLALTIGGEEEAYQKDREYLFCIDEITSPFKSMAKLCQMEWIPGFFLMGVHKGVAEKDLKKHGENYRELIIKLRDEKLELENVEEIRFMKSTLEKIEEKR